MQFCVTLGHLGFYQEFYLLPSFTQGTTVCRFDQPTMDPIIGSRGTVLTICNVRLPGVREVYPPMVEDNRHTDD